MSEDEREGEREGEREEMRETIKINEHHVILEKTIDISQKLNRLSKLIQPQQHELDDLSFIRNNLLSMFSEQGEGFETIFEVSDHRVNDGEEVYQSTAERAGSGRGR